MFPTNFFENYLRDVVGISTQIRRTTGSKLMFGLLKMSKADQKITAASLMAFTGVSRNRFYYYGNDISTLWGHVLKASLFQLADLTAPQREALMNEIAKHVCTDSVSFVRAVSLLINQNYPVRREPWNQGYIVLLDGGLFFLEAGKIGMRPWTPSQEDMLSDDWLIALPFKSKAIQ